MRWVDRRRGLVEHFTLRYVLLPVNRDKKISLTCRGNSYGEVSKIVFARLLYQTSAMLKKDTMMTTYAALAHFHRCPTAMARVLKLIREHILLPLFPIIPLVVLNENT